MKDYFEATLRVEKLKHSGKWSVWVNNMSTLPFDTPEDALEEGLGMIKGLRAAWQRRKEGRDG